MNFAREHGVKLVIKGAGHDYKGRSCAPNSLLVWTHNMREVRFHESFRITGAAATRTGRSGCHRRRGRSLDRSLSGGVRQPALCPGRWLHHVGAAGGFIQGGGYGSFSKRYGTGAGSVIEFEVVTADGEIRIANAAQNADLFWALRGGGGGTFGVVTKVTLRAHETPRTFGILRGTIKAPNDAAFKALIARFVAFYPQALNNPTWGEQIAIRTDNSFDMFMTYLDLDEAQARAAWAPLVEGLPKDHQVVLNARDPSVHGAVGSRLLEENRSWFRYHRSPSRRAD